MTIFANPLRFDATGDFWTPKTEDEALLAEVELLIMTRKRAGNIQGEIIWDQEFGTLIEHLIHARETVDATEVAAELQEAFRKYIGDGRIQVVSVTVGKGLMHVRLQYGKTQNTTLTIPVSI